MEQLSSRGVEALLCENLGQSCDSSICPSLGSMLALCIQPYTANPNNGHALFISNKQHVNKMSAVKPNNCELLHNLFI